MKIQLDLKDRIGKGAFGSVFSGTFEDRQVAVKRVELLDANGNEEDTLKQLDHPHIAKLFHVEFNDEFKYFALELCVASLDQIFLDSENPKKYKGPKLPHHSTVCSQLASGLDYIHLKKLIHRDIKPANVLIHVDPTTGQVTMKWADFGLSRTVNERGTFTINSGIKGTKNWYAPELLKLSSQFQSSKQPRGTVKSDVFAQGLVFAYLLLDGQHLYGNDYEISANIMADNPVNINKIDQSHYALELFTKMLVHDHEGRISSGDVATQLNIIKQKLAEKEWELRQLCKERHVNLNKIKSLIQFGIDVNGKDEDGNNALHLLCTNHSSERLIEAIAPLIKSKIDVKGENNYGSNALHLLCLNNSSKGLIEAMNLLIQQGIDVNRKDNYGRNALHYLCYSNSSDKLVDAIEFLVQRGIDVHGIDKDGWNALHLLCRFNSSKRFIEAIKLLIQLGIDVKSNGNIDARILLRINSTFNQSEKTDDIVQLLDKAAS
ncbi:serine/threonine-protein kinase/endoribonuclease IRE2-like [Daphnia pulex]|uniref:serine/threonine-protein kinase/endoribonuclease IRE2-like n=1 Tax=Daphnia pulex TaxID=6669 RepID=UPI001EDF7D9D|nr:serine/threonine-protein kinase/endoribonuclease IRE2-like [Daphnia pulex]XP_046457502.1 serine/threonine-protein kinase/endoribonuclease IRE2-like [Daphnia pulex]